MPPNLSCSAKVTLSLQQTTFAVALRTLAVATTRSVSYILRRLSLDGILIALTPRGLRWT